jgi:lactate racemase
MKETITLKYGAGTVSLDIANAGSIQVLKSRPMEYIEDMYSALEAVFDNPIESSALKDLVAKGDKITLVISDVTRFWMRQDIVIPPVVNYLNNIGIDDKDICILVATGTHRGQSEEEHIKLVTKDIYDRIEVLDHNCDAEDLVYVGTTSRNTVVKVNPLVVNRKIICIGAVIHHIMAGYGGGRKSILPGVSSRETIKQNHLHSLDPLLPKSNPLIGSGVLESNPLNEDMSEACSFVNPTFMISLAVDANGNHSKIFGGHWLHSWLEGCRWINNAYGVDAEKKGDIVIASCGGFPKDISLYQSTKSLFNASLAVKDGGTIILIAECVDGGGGEDFFGWNKPLIEGRLDAALRENFTIPGYIFFAAVEVTTRAKVIMLTSIKEDVIAPMGIKAFNCLEKLAQEVDFNGKDVIVMPYAGSMIPEIKLNSSETISEVL